jgi:hypothetical protein
MSAEFKREAMPDVVRIVVMDPVNVDEGLEVITQVINYAESVPYKVYVIMDFTKTHFSGMPPGAMRVATTPLFQNAQKYYVIAVGTNSTLSAVGKALMHILGQDNFQATTTNEEALKLIEVLRIKGQIGVG